MKVILQEDVKGQGKKGQIVEVSDGYARNFLIPRKLAVAANSVNMNAVKIHDEALKNRHNFELGKARELAKNLESKIVKIAARGGAGGKLFGSITAKEISEELQAQHGVSIEKNKIHLDEHIKAFGTFEVKVKLYPEVSGTLYVTVFEAEK